MSRQLAARSGAASCSVYTVSRHHLHKISSTADQLAVDEHAYHLAPAQQSPCCCGTATKLEVNAWQVNKLLHSATGQCQGTLGSRSAITTGQNAPYTSAHKHVMHDACIYTHKHICVYISIVVCEKHIHGCNIYVGLLTQLKVAPVCMTLSIMATPSCSVSPCHLSRCDSPACQVHR